MCKISQIVFLFCFAFFSLAGCKPNHRYIYEGFSVSNTNVNYSSTVCSLSLKGEEQYAGKDNKTGMSLSYFRSPYNILISFYFPKEQSGLVELKYLSFYMDGLKVKSKEVNSKKKFDNKTIFRKGGVRQIREEKESRAFFLIKQVKIPHSKLKLGVTALITEKNVGVVKKWTFELTPFVEEKLRNDQKDSFMSI